MKFPKFPFPDADALSFAALNSIFSCGCTIPWAGPWGRYSKKSGKSRY